MKKFVLLFAVIAICFLHFLPFPTAVAEEKKDFYAKIPSTGVYFCTSPNDASALFEIPFSYFVKVDGVVNDFFKVTYRDLSGYVKKQEVNLMNGQPQNAFDNTTFNVYLPFSLYQQASSSVEIATLNPSMRLSFYGKKVGEELKVGKSDWYYSSVVIDGQLLRGYVYSDHAPQPITTGQNDEKFPIVSEDLLSTTSSSTFGGLTTGTKVILIVAISVPSLLILYFLIKPSKIMQITKTKRKPKTQPKRIRHGDYFEFDENEL